MPILSNIQQRRLTNARKPAGTLGRLLVTAMNISHSQMTDWGLGHLSIGKQDAILDVGCGGGGTIHKLAKATHGKVYGIDFSHESVLVSRTTNKRFVQLGRVAIQQGSVSCLPFSEGVFDLVTAVNTHNYWPDLVNDMQEVLRVLKPRGKFALIGSVYKGGRHDKRNQEFATLVPIAFPSVTELRELLLRAGYLEIEMFEQHDRSWICSISTKPQ